jgi:hypothetical protein
MEASYMDYSRIALENIPLLRPQPKSTKLMKGFPSDLVIMNIDI